jgi:acyl carrier protein
MSDIRAVVRDFILAQCLPGESPENLRDDMALRTTGILDSMSTLKLVSVIEETQGFEIEAHEVDDENFRSVDDIVTFVERRRDAR